jgi:hypothetical protein
MRDDLLLDNGGDLKINGNGDIVLTESMRQAVLIRLRWFFAEWRFAPEFGVPWFEDVLVKNPNDARIRRIIREECMQVDGVKDVRGVTLAVDSATREAVIYLKIITEEQTYAEEVKIKL